MTVLGFALDLMIINFDNFLSHEKNRYPVNKFRIQYNELIP